MIVCMPWFAGYLESNQRAKKFKDAAICALDNIPESFNGVLLFQVDCAGKVWPSKRKLSLCALCFTCYGTLHGFHNGASRMDDSMVVLPNAMMLS